MRSTVPALGTLSSVVLCLLAAAPSARASFTARDDLRFVAIDVRKGRVLWTFVPEKMGDGHCEVYETCVVLIPSHPQRLRGQRFLLDRGTGARLKEALRLRPQPLARSSVFLPAPPIAMRNGLQLKGFSQGNTKELKFYKKGSRNPSVTIALARWPHNVCAFQNLVMFDYGGSAKEAIVYAYDVEAPQKPKWTLDLNKHITGSLKPAFHGLNRHIEGRKTRMFKQVLDGELYVNADEHLFCIEPANGRILWQRNLAKDLGLRFVPDFFGGGLNIAPMAKEGDVVIVAFENRIVAYDQKARKYLWWAMPDTFPHTPFPALHGGVLYVNAGKGLKIQALDGKTRRRPRPEAAVVP